MIHINDYPSINKIINNIFTIYREKFDNEEIVNA